DEDVWAGLDEVQSPAVAEAPPEPAPPAAPPASMVEPPLTARVEQRPPRAPFERPAVEPLHSSREPFEPPVITPITPREQTALLGTRSADQPLSDRHLPDEPPRPSAGRRDAAES